MIKRSFNFLFWGGIVAFIAYTVSNRFDSFEVANTEMQQERYEKADLAISKYNASNHKTIRAINGYILQADISEQMDRLYLAKELASQALILSKQESLHKATCLSENSLQHSKLLIGELDNVEQPLFSCLQRFNEEKDDFNKLKTLLNLAHYYSITDNKEFVTLLNQSQQIVDKKESLSYLLVDLYVDAMNYYLKHNQTAVANQMIDTAIFLQKKHFSKQPSKLAYLNILKLTPNIVIGTPKNISNFKALETIQSTMKNKDLAFSLSMKIHTLLIMGQIYKNLEDLKMSTTCDQKAMELFNTFPTKEIHAIEGAMIYKQLILDYSKNDPNHLLEKTTSDATQLLQNFPLIKQHLMH